MGFLRTGMPRRGIPVFFQFRQRTALSELKRSCSRFAPLTLRCRTEPALRAAPVFRSAYFPIPHRPTFGAPVFRSAYSASRNARASAAFAASIKPYYGLISKTLDLQVRFAHPPMGGGSFALPFLRTGMFFQNIPVFRSAYFPQRVHSTLCSKTLDLQPLRGLRWAGGASLPPAPPSPAPAFHRPLRGLRQTDSQRICFHPPKRGVCAAFPCAQRRVLLFFSQQPHPLR